MTDIVIKKSIGEMIRETLYKNESIFLPLLDADKLQMQKMAINFSFSLIDSKLTDCSIQSMIRAFKKCCEYNLNPASGMGKIFLVPYDNKQNGEKEVNAQVGYKGLLEMAMRYTSIVSNVYANIVYEGDEFEVEYSNNIAYRHVPKFKSRELWLTYAVVKFSNGDIQIEVSNKEDIEKSKSLSKSANHKYSPWSQHYNSMAKIVPLRKIASIALSLTCDTDEYISNYDIEKREKESKVVNANHATIESCDLMQ